MSPLRSSAGPAVCTNGTSSSAARICASDVLPSPGGPASSTWSSASPRAAAASSDDRRAAPCSAGLADELLQAPRPQRAVELRPRTSTRGRLDALGAHRPGRLAARAASSSSARVAAGAGEQRVGLGERRSRARAGRRGRACAGRRRGATTIGPSARPGVDADLLAQLDHDPLRGPLADARHGLEARGVAGGERADELARRAAAEHRQRDLRPDALHADQQQEQVALLLGGEAVETSASSRTIEVGVQRDRPADRGHVAQRLGRDGEPVADAATPVSTTTWSARRTATSPATRAIIAAPATARPRAARGWRGRSRRRARRRRGRAWRRRSARAAPGPCAPTWSLSARPVPQTAPLTCCGV